MIDDSLLEIATMGGAHAASALSKLLNKRVDISVPTIHLLHSPDEFNINKGSMCCETQSFEGDRKGHIIFAISEKEVKKLLEGIIDVEGQNEELISSALSEFANIMDGAFIGAYSSMLNLGIKYSAPKYSISSISKLVEELIGSPSSIMCAKVQYTIDGRNTEAYTIFLPMFDLMKEFEGVYKIK